LLVQLVVNQEKMIIRTAAAIAKATDVESAVTTVTIGKKAVMADVVAEAEIAFKVVVSKVKVAASEETEEMTTDLAQMRATWKAQAQMKE
jgi:hypothetical protein